MSKKVLGTLVEEQPRELEENDFWEGQKFEWLGKLMGLAVPTGIALLVLAGVFAAGTYNQGAECALSNESHWCLTGRACTPPCSVRCVTHAESCSAQHAIEHKRWAHVLHNCSAIVASHWQPHTADAVIRAYDRPDKERAMACRPYLPGAGQQQQPAEAIAQ